MHFTDFFAVFGMCQTVLATVGPETARDVGHSLMQDIQRTGAEIHRQIGLRRVVKADGVDAKRAQYAGFGGFWTGREEKKTTTTPRPAPSVVFYHNSHTYRPPQAACSWRGDRFYQGDIALTPAQQRRLLADLERHAYGQCMYPAGGLVACACDVHTHAEPRHQRRHHRRHIESRPERSWPSPVIPYDIDESLVNTSMHPSIFEGMALIESASCIRFRARSRTIVSPSQSYLLFVGNDNAGCQSYVGRLADGRAQPIRLVEGCEGPEIAHELLHALGVWHEHGRPDRDHYVFIDPDAVPAGEWYNFVKATSLQTDDFDLPYDYGSLMHYGNNMYNTERQTIYTWETAYNNTIGSRMGLSFKDAKLIHLKYCSAICPPGLECANGGFADSAACARCRCPSGFGGPRCRDAAHSTDDVCPPTAVVADGEPGRLQFSGAASRHKSSKYLQTNDYALHGLEHMPFERRCVVHVRARRGRVALECAHLKADAPDVFVCDQADSFVEVKYLRDKSLTGARLCNPWHCGWKFESADEHLVLIFRSKPSALAWHAEFTYRESSSGRKGRQWLVVVLLAMVLLMCHS